MSSAAALKLEAELDPVMRAIMSAREGAPLTEEEQRDKERGALEPWVDGEEMTAQIARRRPNT